MFFAWQDRGSGLHLPGYLHFFPFTDEGPMCALGWIIKAQGPVGNQYVNGSIYDFDWVFLEIPVKHCIVGMLLTCLIVSSRSFSHEPHKPILYLKYINNNKVESGSVSLTYHIIQSMSSTVFVFITGTYRGDNSTQAARERTIHWYNTFSSYCVSMSVQLTQLYIQCIYNNWL